MSPGPSLAVVIRNTVQQGRRAGLATALSHALGVGLYALATALGLAALVATQQALFNGLTLAGSAYLLWLGAHALRGTGRFEASTDAPVITKRPWGSVRDGLAMALLNPKIAVFFLALFSQFTRPDAGILEVAILAGTATAVDAGWYAAVALVLSGQGLSAWLRRYGVWIERLTGAVLVFLALTTAIRALGG
ncbi:MAG: LysE family translocator [Spiribacter sp.]|jgi:threonine/homoserine/homoserine lactone efflux protein|nr:LysE family translocator [Spiribacter sp.]MDR9455363.1 LysE family translocator [Spiribacter sp.]